MKNLANFRTMWIREKNLVRFSLCSVANIQIILHLLVPSFANTQDIVWNRIEAEVCRQRRLHGSAVMQTGDCWRSSQRSYELNTNPQAAFHARKPLNLSATSAGINAVRTVHISDARGQWFNEGVIPIDNYPGRGNDGQFYSTVQAHDVASQRTFTELNVFPELCWCVSTYRKCTK